MRGHCEAAEVRDHVTIPRKSRRYYSLHRPAGCGARQTAPRPQALAANRFAINPALTAIIPKLWKYQDFPLPHRYNGITLSLDGGADIGV
jgi:hypothetical protein